jgi:hypothetical protein
LPRVPYAKKADEPRWSGMFQCGGLTSWTGIVEEIEKYDVTLRPEQKEGPIPTADQDRMAFIRATEIKDDGRRKGPFANGTLDPIIIEWLRHQRKGGTVWPEGVHSTGRRRRDSRAISATQHCASTRRGAKICMQCGVSTCKPPASLPAKSRS